MLHPTEMTAFSMLTVRIMPLLCPLSGALIFLFFRFFPHASCPPNGRSPLISSSCFPHGSFCSSSVRCPGLFSLLHESPLLRCFKTHSEKSLFSSFFFFYFFFAFFLMRLARPMDVLLSKAPHAFRMGAFVRRPSAVRGFHYIFLTALINTFPSAATRIAAAQASGIPEPVMVPMTSPHTAVSATFFAAAYSAVNRK